MKGDNPENSREFLSIKEGVSQEAKSKSRKKQKQDIKRRERGAELADKAQQKLKKKTAKAANVAKLELDSEVKPIFHSLTPPKRIRDLTIATHPVFDDVLDPLVEDQQLLSTSDKKEEKRLRRLKRVEKREDKSVIGVRSKSLEKLSRLINKRDENYSGAKFAFLLDLAEKILVVDAIPGATIEQKANKVAKDITDLEKQIEPPKPEAADSMAVVLRAETPGQIILMSKYLDNQAVMGPDQILHCRWKRCGKQFNTLKHLFSHVCKDHIIDVKDGVAKRCRWNHCKTTIFEIVKRQHLINHMHDDYCDWSSSQHGKLRDHVKSVHWVQFGRCSEDPVDSNDVRKRKRGHDDDAVDEGVPSKSSKRRRLGDDVGLTREESVVPKQKKRKVEKESIGNLEDQIELRPKKKLKR